MREDESTILKGMYKKKMCPPGQTHHSINKQNFKSGNLYKLTLAKKESLVLHSLFCHFPVQQR
jgi:hypothetical protein